MSRATPIVFVGASLFLLSACGAHRNNRSQTTTVSSAALQTGYREAQVAAEEVSLGKYAEALARADNALRLAPNNAWAAYNRAIALHRLGRADSAIEAYRAAEASFGADEWGKSLAIYGRARVLDDVGRCDEAKQAYGEFAALVRPKDAPAVEMALDYATECRAKQSPPGPENAVLTQMASALIAGQFAQVLELKDKFPASAEPNPWLDYNVGSALAGLHRTDEAIAAFNRAEQGFGDRDRWGRSVAIWGRARALEQAGRCREADRAVEEYARVVGGSDPSAIRIATAYNRRCE